MKVRNTGSNLVLTLILFIFQLLFTMPAGAQDSSFEVITSVVPDTGNMNEGNAANRRFSAQFTVSLATTTADCYREPQNASGTAQTIYVKAFVSWRNDSNFTHAFSGSFTPVSGDNLQTEKTFSFSLQNPTSWSNPIRLVIMARYKQDPPGGAPFSFGGRGSIWNNLVNTPPPSSDVSLGGGSTYYESLDSFSGSIGEAMPDGRVKLNFYVGVKIFINPLGGAYDPTREGVRVWVDTSGGTNPTTLIYEEAKLAGAYWASVGKPSLPFILPFTGSYIFTADTPGVIVGGVGLRWPPWPILGSNATWGQQNTYTWRLPPRGITIDVPSIVYETVSHSYTASVVLRSLQIASRVTGYQWVWGDGNSTGNLNAGQSSSSLSKTYDTPGTYQAKCIANYKNSDTHSTSLEIPFTVTVKPLPRIYPPDQIKMKDMTSAAPVAFPGEDKACHYYALGSTQLICQENQTSNYSVYYRFFDSTTTTSYSTSSFLSLSQQSQSIPYTFTTLGNKKVELWVRYKKAEVQNGHLVSIAANNGDGYYHHLLSTRIITVESQQVLEDSNEHKITFSVSQADGETMVERSLTQENQETTVKFIGNAAIFYARRDENTTIDPLDQKSGVRPGSVEYRWKILTPDNQDACVLKYAQVSDPSLLGWKTLDGTSSAIDPISVTFRVPFGTSVNPDRFYRVILEAKYRELRWEPVMSESDNTKIIAWKDNVNYLNNSSIREIIFNSVSLNSSPNDFAYRSDSQVSPPLNREGNGPTSDLLLDGSLGVKVRISDRIPARFVAVTAPTSGTTGDPLGDPGFSIVVSDNNPD
ncbi:MAG TPA: hypothetical protein PLK58_14765, partial [Candidatus Rifleibacterium sp.]|nr:hypothetical protein [Candidatus Rifleibacterium sp.]